MGIKCNLVRCNEEVVKGRKQCVLHLKEACDRSKQKQLERKVKNVCVICGLKKLINGQVNCCSCLVKHRDYERNRQRNLKLAGKCCQCGADAPLKDNGKHYSMCYLCAIKRREQQRKRLNFRRRNLNAHSYLIKNKKEKIK